MQSQRFVLVAGQRTGSTLLVKSLDSSPRVFCAGEIFHTGPNVYHGEFRFPYASAKTSAPMRLLNAVRMKSRARRHLEWFYHEAAASVEAVGFKLMTSHTRTFPWIMLALRNLGARPVYLYRQDVLATAISYYKAKVTGVFHSDRAGYARPAQPQLELDEAEFRRVIELCKTNKRQIEALCRTYGGTLLAYEDMIGDWPAFVARIGSVIGVNGLMLQKAITKLESGVNSPQLVDEDLLRERFGVLVAE